jgi:flagellar biosynthesis/type III secretory pathway protein FliH
MQTIEELTQNLNLNPDQSEAIKIYINSLLIELLESIKQDHIKNFEETIENLRNNP